MRLSIISSLHGNLHSSQEMLASLLATIPADADCEILLIDDASPDDTANWLRTVSEPRVRALFAEKNLGFGAANNRAARESGGEVLVLVNNDVVLQPGWLEPLIAGLARCASPGVIGNLQYTADTGELDHRGVRMDLLRRPFHDRTPRPWHARRDYSCYPAVTAACCAIRRQTFLDAGGFDERYRNGYEDIDLCLRLGRSGFRHYVANGSHIRHHVSISPGRFAQESTNLSLFLSRWGWPPPGPPYRLRGINYLGRHWLRPWRYNGSKLVLAFAWFLTGRPCAALERKLGVSIKLVP